MLAIEATHATFDEAEEEEEDEGREDVGLDVLDFVPDIANEDVALHEFGESEDDNHIAETDATESALPATETSQSQTDTVDVPAAMQTKGCSEQNSNVVAEQVDGSALALAMTSGATLIDS